MELRANDTKLQHKASHRNSGNFTSCSCTAISIQSSFFPLSTPMDLSLVVTYGCSLVPHSFCCPCRPQATEAGHGSNLPQEARHDQRKVRAVDGMHLLLLPAASCKEPKNPLVPLPGSFIITLEQNRSHGFQWGEGS